MNKKFLIIGHPRGGTGYSAALLQSFGFDVGHETMGEDGTSCWAWGPDTHHQYKWAPGIKTDYTFDKILHCIRDPRRAVTSIYMRENSKPLSLAYRLRYMKLPVINKRIDLAVASYLQWHYLCENNNKIDLTFKVEDAVKPVHKFLTDEGYIEKPISHYTYPPTNVNSHKHRDIPEREWDNLSDNYREELNTFCNKWNYALI